MASRGPFEGFRVLVTGVRHSERAGLDRLLREGGASLVVEFDSESASSISLIVTRAARSPRALYVRDRAPNTPVVLPEWVHASVEAGRAVATTEHAAPPFSGLTVCLSGLAPAVKADFARRLARVGAVHSGVLDLQCTHLVTCTTASEKYRFAIANRIVCVRPEWLEGSLAKGEPLPVAPYAVADGVALRDAARGASEARTGAAAATATTATATDEPPSRAGSRGSCRTGEASLDATGPSRAAAFPDPTIDGAPDRVATTYACAETRAAGDESEAGLAGGSDGVLPGQNASGAGADGELGRALKRARGAAGTGSSEGLGTGGQTPRSSRGAGKKESGGGKTRAKARGRASQRSSEQSTPDAALIESPLERRGTPASPRFPAEFAERLTADGASGGARTASGCASDSDLEWPDDAPAFLDSVRVFLSGCTPAETRRCLRALRRGGGRRAQLLTAEASHVVVGSGVYPEVAREIERARRLLPGLEVATPAWLEACLAALRLVPATGALAADLSAADRGSAASRGVGSHSQLASRGAGSQTASLFAQSSLAASSLAGRPPRSASLLGDPGLSQDGSGLFAGLHFTLAGLRGDPEAASRARSTIQGMGGRVFNESSLSRLPGLEVARALCPPSLPPRESARLSAASPDFAAVPEAQRVTVYWLECCAAAGEVLRPGLGAPLFRPLRYAVPLQDMRGVLVCASLYPKAVREAARRGIELLGGRFADDAMTRRHTHLLVPVASGEKFRHCDAYGVRPVTAAWLVDTIARGLRQPEDAYRPRPPKSATPADPKPAPVSGTSKQPSRDAARTELSAGGRGRGGSTKGTAAASKAPDALTVAAVARSTPPRPPSPRMWGREVARADGASQANGAFDAGGGNVATDAGGGNGGTDADGASGVPDPGPLSDDEGDDEVGEEDGEDENIEDDALPALARLPRVPLGPLPELRAPRRRSPQSRTVPSSKRSWACEDPGGDDDVGGTGPRSQFVGYEGESQPYGLGV